MNRFTAYYIDIRNEWEVCRNDEIFCHLSESDFELFYNNFKYNIVILNTF